MTLDTMYSKEMNRVRCSFSCLEDLWCPRTPSTLNVSRPKPRLRLRQARDLTQRYQVLSMSGSVPLDLALNAPYHTRDGGTNVIPFDGPLRDALRSRVACDSV